MCVDELMLGVFTQKQADEVGHTNNTISTQNAPAQSSMPMHHVTALRLHGSIVTFNGLVFAPFLVWDVH